MNVMVENHGSFSSIPECMVALVKGVDHPRFGLLPTMVILSGDRQIQGLEMVMPYAKGVSVKCMDFAADGTHAAYDLDRMVEISLLGLPGFFGIEYSGKAPASEGVPACTRLLRKHQV